MRLRARKLGTACMLTRRCEHCLSDDPEALSTLSDYIKATGCEDQSLSLAQSSKRGALNSRISPFRSRCFSGAYAPFHSDPQYCTDHSYIRIPSYLYPTSRLRPLPHPALLFNQTSSSMLTDIEPLTTDCSRTVTPYNRIAH